MPLRATLPVMDNHNNHNNCNSDCHNNNNNTNNHRPIGILHTFLSAAIPRPIIIRLNPLSLALAPPRNPFPRRPSAPTEEEEEPEEEQAAGVYRVTLPIW